jgi:DNA polymerase-3 subunit gamma/tau
MLLVRLTHAADLPTPDEALRMLRDAAASTPAGDRPSPRSPTGGAQAILGGGGSAIAATPMTRPVSDPVASASALPGPRLVASTEPQAVKPVAPPQPTVRLTSLHDVAALAAEKRDIRLKLAVEKQLRPVGFEQGRIDVSPTKDAPFDLPQDLARKLSDWTGIRWVVALSRDEGGATIAEEREAARDRLVTDARADPLVAAVLRRFPGAQIVDVRVNAPEGEDAAAATGDDGTPPSDGDDPGWSPDD